MSIPYSSNVSNPCYPTPIYSSNSVNFSSYSTPRRTASNNTRGVFIQNGSNILKEESKKKLEFSVRDSSLSKPQAFKSGFSTDLKSLQKKSGITKGIVGLKNLGNTCYMNSVLQCVARLPTFRDALLLISDEDTNRSSKLEGKLALAFKDLIEEMRRTNNYEILNPIDVKFLMGKFSKNFSRMEQQDAGEFFRSFLEVLAQDLHRGAKGRYMEMSGNTNEDIREVADRWWEYSLSRESSVVSDCFQGQLVSVIRCSKCGYGSVSCDCFLSLNLPLKDSSFRTCDIEDSISQFFSGSVIESFSCERCNAKADSRQTTSVFRYPKILVLQVKRFSATPLVRSKLNTEIQLKHNIDLAKYKHPSSKGQNSYSLTGIIHHRGSLYSGHYICECKEQGTWYCFDDDRVTQALTPNLSSSAYLLFYISNSIGN